MKKEEKLYDEIPTEMVLKQAFETIAEWYEDYKQKAKEGDEFYKGACFGMYAVTDFIVDELMCLGLRSEEDIKEKIGLPCFDYEGDFVFKKKEK